MESRAVTKLLIHGSRERCDGFGDFHTPTSSDSLRKHANTACVANIHADARRPVRDQQYYSAEALFRYLTAGWNTFAFFCIFYLYVRDAEYGISPLHSIPLFATLSCTE